MRLERYGFRFFLAFAALPAAGRRAMTAADERDDAPDRSEMSRQWRPVLLAYFLRRVNDHAEAEDLAQEMMVRLLGMDELGRAHLLTLVTQSHLYCRVLTRKQKRRNGDNQKKHKSKI